MNIAELPKLSVDEAKSLPKAPCVYFVVNDAGEVLYIGSSVNLRQRWSVGHHRAQQAQQAKADIAWMDVDESKIRAAEARFIRGLKPLWNGQPYPKVDRHKHEILSIRTTPEVRELLDDLTELDGRSDSSVVERIIRAEHKRRWSEIEAHHEWKMKAAGLRKK